jgi:aminomuconate-semialdehyde/2-hydroxymuconate-6-semialdehyde dehydrogenase
VIVGSHLIREKLRDHQRLVAEPCPGKWVESGRVFEKINPVNGSKVCDVSEADSETVDRAVQAARAAVACKSGGLSAAERAALLHKVADRIEARFEEFRGSGDR